MKYNERFFKFPVRLSLGKDIAEREELSEKLGIDLPEDFSDIDFVVGWESIDIEEISGYGTLFSREKTLDDVREEGFDCTMVYLRNGKEIGCFWPPEKFEEELSTFSTKLESIIRGEMDAERERLDTDKKKKNWFQKIFNI